MALILRLVFCDSNPIAGQLRHESDWPASQQQPAISQSAASQPAGAPRNLFVGNESNEERKSELKIKSFRILQTSGLNMGLPWHAFHLMIEALPPLLYILLIMIWFFSSLIFLAEPQDTFQSSYVHAMWFTVCTLSTVGYWDVYPKTYVGRAISSVLIVCSVS